MWLFDKLKNVSRSILKSNVDEQLAFPQRVVAPSGISIVWMHTLPLIPNWTSRSTTQVTNSITLLSD